MAAKLQEAGIIDSALAFRIDAHIQSKIEGLKAGEYQFLPHMSIMDVIALLQSGKTYQHKITIPEGLMSVEIVNLLNKEPVLTGKIDPVPPEGSLLPETYKFSYGDTRQSVINRMKKSMRDTLDSLWQTREPGYLLSQEETVVLASIVEKETGIAAERPHIAAVFENRLRIGMRLQSDPTIIYGITQGYPLGRRIKQSEIEARTPFNTYVIAGLPPQPICNPGKDSLAAVLNPADSRDLYFVADGTGGHVFASNPEEQARNVAKWRRIHLQKN